MPQVAAEYEHLDEWSDLAKSIVDKYSEQFYGIDLDRIRAVQITNKERSEKNPKLFDIKAVPMPIALDCKYSHYIIVYAEDWNGMEEKHKQLLVAQTLCAIAIDDNGDMVEGKVNSFDMKDYALMLRTFGPDYLVRENVPDLLGEQVQWKDLL